MEEEIKEKEAGEMKDYRPPTREERVELLKQTHNDNVEERLQEYIKGTRKALKEFKKLYKGDSMNSLGVYYDLRMAWENMALYRYPHIATYVELGVLYLLLDESPSTTDSTIIRIRSGLGRCFYVDDGKDDNDGYIIMVSDVPSAIEAIKFFDETYKQKIRNPPSYTHPKLHIGTRMKRMIIPISS